MEDEQSQRGDQKPDQDLPGSVSDQNAEEQPGPGPAQSGQKDPRGNEGGSSGGESGEGSQSTGSPDSAG